MESYLRPIAIVVELGILMAVIYSLFAAVMFALSDLGLDLKYQTFIKWVPHAELIMAAKSVLSDKRYLSPGISERVLEGYLDGKKTLKHQTSWETLTQRQREILKLIAEGYRNKQIAEDLCLSVKTVEKHRDNLMKKLALHNAQALTAFAIEKRLVGRE